MNDTIQFLNVFANLPLAALVLARLGGFMTFAPFFGSVSIPVKMRGLLALAIAVVILPFVKANLALPQTSYALLATMVTEFLIGLMFALGLMAIFTALELAGRMVGQQMGIGLARVFDPLANEQNTVLGQLYFWLALVIFLVVGGHHILLDAVIRSFGSLPPGSVLAAGDVVEVMAGIVQTSFVVALKISAPVIITIFLATLALGFVGRTVPQLNILSIGFPLRVLMGYILAIICLTVAVDVFLAAFQNICDRLLGLLAL